MKLSVCIPVYNVAPYIEQCARSLFGQTCEDMEFVFVDDCSPDDSIAVLRRVLEDFPHRKAQVKILRHEQNRGLIAARKTAIRTATGELLAHCDSDDWLEPDAYAKLIRRLDQSGSDMVIGSICGEFSDGRRSLRAPDEGLLSAEEAVAAFGTIPGLTSMVNKVYRRDLYQRAKINWPNDVRIAEDVCHMMQLIAQCGTVAFEPSAVYHYRIHGASMTNAADPCRIVDDHIAVFRILSEALPESAGTPCLRYLAGTVLYWGMAHAGFPCRQFRKWARTHRELGGAYDFPTACKWGRRVMALARVSPWLASCMARALRSRIRDML